MTIAKEEIFGPVVSIIPFSSEEEAIKISNDTSYGLTNYIQTEDKEKAHRVAKQLRSGMVEINGELVLQMDLLLVVLSNLAVVERVELGV